MSDMFRRAVICMERAEDALKKVPQDDAYLNFACFDTQQAIEFLIKDILIEQGVEPARTHSITELFQSLKSIKFTFEKEDSLDYLADTITAWETSRRYGSGIRTTAQTVQRVQDIYFSMMSTYIVSQSKLQEVSFVESLKTKGAEVLGTSE